MSKLAEVSNKIIPKFLPSKASRIDTQLAQDGAVIDGPKTPADEAIDFFESIPSANEEPIQVYELRLEEDGGPNKDRAYTRLPPPYKPYVLRVTMDAGTPASKNGVFKTNFPLDGGVFDRDRFQQRRLPTDLSKPIKVDLPISHAGAFVYWVEYDNPISPDAKPERVKGREGYFNIDPILRVKKRSAILAENKPSVPGGGALTLELTNLPLDGLAILTLVSKWMGPIDQWDKHLTEASERGYNMIHWTPLQQRGESKSPYSIADQLAFDSEIFENGWKGTREEGAKIVGEKLRQAKDDFGLMGLIDVVLNHTANNSLWLLDHPEAGRCLKLAVCRPSRVPPHIPLGYSPHNSPHLAPAYEIDTAIVDLSASLSTQDLPTIITSSADVEKLISALRQKFAALDLWQYYVLDVRKEKSSVQNALSSEKVLQWSGANVAGKNIVELAHVAQSSGKILGLGQFRGRFEVKADPEYAAALVKAAFTELSDPGALADAWGDIVDVINVPLYEEANEDLKAAINGVRNRVNYIRLDPHGPRLGAISAESPLVETYFTRLPENKRTSKHPKSALALANNGWIWDANPLQNFAQLPSKAYLRREVIVWSDCVKLRYGASPKDNPWLWEYMTKYVQSLAELFDGFRIDNCHSTPLHVGVTLLDAARVVNPNLYVIAELFTGNEETDVHFVSRLGINSLIREAYNGWDPKEFSRLLYRHGLGKPIGSMDTATLVSAEELPSPTGKGPSRPATVTPLQGSAPHAVMFDLTHDNESPLDKRSAEDALSTGALVTFAHCGVGSNKGFDDLYPKLLNLVGENRRYGVETGEQKTGIAKAKRLLNHLHTEMILEGYTEGHVHQENDYIVIHRVQPNTHHGYVLVAHTAFRKGSKDRGWINPIQLRRTKVKYIFGVSIDIPSYEIAPNASTLRGLTSTLSEIPEVLAKEGSDGDGPFSEISIPDAFPPGSILLFATQMEGIDTSLDVFCASGADEAFRDLDLVDLNVVLYRADGEERDATAGKIGTYSIPGSGNLVYCGLEGWMAPLRHITTYNDLGHPLCAHLRDGAWAFDYVHHRLKVQTDNFPRLAAPAAWFEERFEKIKATTPSFLKPKYFAIAVVEAYKAARRAVVEQSSDFISSGHDFTQALALCSVQMYGQVSSASLHPAKSTPSLAAGLPHFTAGWARCWGRDVFISLRGLFLTTGNFDAARRHILTFSSTLKHGLIPNLLDSVRTPRYNSRDSPWFMLQNIQDYTKFAPEGLTILSESVKRRFPKDDTFVPWNDSRAYSDSSTIAEIIQEVLQRHAWGISFREHNAGPNLDMQMKAEGFNVNIYVDWKTGFVHGGSAFNCGTWMDKMGESERAGTKGVPGTPRDGAPVEITGLVKSALRWLDELSRSGKFPFKGVDAKIEGRTRLITYGEWGNLIQASFEKYYYVPLGTCSHLEAKTLQSSLVTDPADDTSHAINPALVNQRGIYKDVYGSGPGREWSDYQLRCNFPIAMVVAPELFNNQHAISSLRIADQRLRSPLGMKTLDAADAQYRGSYDNSNDSDDPAIAKGRNYHQGPEWGWPLGFFLRAYLSFDLKAGEGQTNPQETLHYLHTLLLPSRKYIRTDPWAGLPELTNADGAYCHDSCRTQAWSASTLLDFLHEVYTLNQSK
ncbi:glycoside hydrolase family 13 protein [Cantharellus anzutake]|uniref:glycoside hydrolase family 13 protein n=1 Tax=Cantharellus anzutake TaxID=1750568 RepID=UPI001908A7D3|nr:glycoside hydrolase family 13 protein [Cantharellus anzutake]KAF8325872.1 glycoside hydrolase family 13 protein [Cantharellus anzutake]